MAFKFYGNNFFGSPSYRNVGLKMHDNEGGISELIRIGDEFYGFDSLCDRISDLLSMFRKYSSCTSIFDLNVLMRNGELSKENNNIRMELETLERNLDEIRSSLMALTNMLGKRKMNVIRNLLDKYSDETDSSFKRLVTEKCKKNGIKISTLVELKNSNFKDNY